MDYKSSGHYGDICLVHCTMAHRLWRCHRIFLPSPGLRCTPLTSKRVVDAVRVEFRQMSLRIQTEKASCLAYVLLILQHALKVRLVLLTCVAGIMEHSVTSVDLQVVACYMHLAHRTQHDFSDLYLLWVTTGLLSLADVAECRHCNRKESYICCDFSFNCVTSKHCESTTVPHVLLHASCPFLWILTRSLWGLRERLSLLFERYFLPLPSSRSQSSDRWMCDGQTRALQNKGERANANAKKEVKLSTGDAVSPRLEVPKACWSSSSLRIGTHVPQCPLPVLDKLSPSHGECRTSALPNPSAGCVSSTVSGLGFTSLDSGSPNRLSVDGCSCLYRFLNELTHLEGRTTVFVMNDCSQRRGQSVWLGNRSVTVAGAGDGSGEHCRIGTSGLVGTAEWEVNFVFPHSRLSTDKQQRAQQEISLLRAIVPSVLETSERRISFKDVDGSTFYMVRSYDDMAEGRMYFGLHQYPTNASPSDVSVSTKEPRHFFSSLESLCAAWSMPYLCNLAVRLAAGIYDPVPE
uniref:Uncharacterized protein n=1 Tax=Trypanosoma vivax (strain Y486) TaxID=1055687 RepID=G0U312_TRYVY|nr:conserved hypothetical protein [Trypanosoma vivax Y486]